VDPASQAASDRASTALPGQFSYASVLSTGLAYEPVGSPRLKPPTSGRKVTETPSDSSIEDSHFTGTETLYVNTSYRNNGRGGRGGNRGGGGGLSFANRHLIEIKTDEEAEFPPLGNGHGASAEGTAQVIMKSKGLPKILRNHAAVMTPLDND